MTIIALAASLVAAAQPSWASRALTDLHRAMTIADSTVERFFDGEKTLSMYYVFDTKQKQDVASVWEYTSAFEAMNSILEALNEVKTIAPDLYAAKYNHYLQLMQKFYNGLEQYNAAAAITSYTRTQNWSVYCVHRGANPANSNYREAVYDDQMWITRELLRAYKLTGDAKFLTRAEYLAQYVMDGWDCTLDNNGNEYGGITWGYGYTSKHACSNGPIVAPLAWLADEYQGSSLSLRYFIIQPDGSRVKGPLNRHDFYLESAKKVYQYHKDAFYDKQSGVFHDMRGGVTGELKFDTIQGRRYRAHVDVGNPGGTKFTYNTGTELSGAAELYRITGEQKYLDDMQYISEAAYSYFTHYVKTDSGYARQWPANNSKDYDNMPWFNDVLLRGLLDVYNYSPSVSKSIELFNDNLDYAWTHYRREGMLPDALVEGWGSVKKMMVQTPFALASDYAMLVKYRLRADNPNAASNVVSLKLNKEKRSGVYDMQGRVVCRRNEGGQSIAGLQHGVYVVDGKKIVNH